MNRKRPFRSLLGSPSIYLIKQKTPYSIHSMYRLLFFLYIFFSFIYIYVYIIINKRDPHKREIQEFLHEFGTLKVRIAKPLTPKTI
jgi:MinD superfamily P-loop ATPase